MLCYNPFFPPLVSTQLRRRARHSCMYMRFSHRLPRFSFGISSHLFNLPHFSISSSHHSLLIIPFSSFPSQLPVRGWHCAQSTSCCISLPPHIPNLIQRPPVPFPPCPCPSLAGPYPILNTKLTTTATPTKSASTLGPNLSSKPPCPLNLILLALQWYVTSA